MSGFDKIEAYLRERMADGLPYCEVVVQKGYDRVYHWEGGTEGHDKRFFLYSCSKTMTVTCVMRLVEEGKLGLDDPVEKWLPAFEKIYLLKNGQKCRPENTMTVRHLLTMTGGLDYDLSKLPIRLAASKPGAGTTDIVNAFAESPICFEPGDHFKYSLCHDVLGAVVESVTGKGFDEYMAEIIFRPLGMERTSFRYREEEMAPQYAFDAEKRVYVPQERRNTHIPAPGYFSGGGGVVSTTEDFARFAMTMACGGRAKNGYQLLKPETIDLLRTEQLSKFAKNTEFSCAAGPGYGYGLGVRTLVNQDNGQRSSIGEFGWDGAAGAYIMCDPAKQVSIVYMMHALGWPPIYPLFHCPIRDFAYAAIEGE